MELTLENLKAKGACKPGIEWITPIIDSPDVWDRLAVEHPEWLQWAHYNGFDVRVSDKVVDQMGITYVDDRLVFVQKAGWLLHPDSG